MKFKWFASYTKSKKIPSDREGYQQSYIEWIEHVKSFVPSDQLLIFKPSDGWKPLCQFLNVPGEFECSKSSNYSTSTTGIEVYKIH